MQNIDHYLGNPLLKKANVSVEWTEEQIIEFQKCMENPLHFIEKYIKIVSLDHGLVPFDMFQFQKEMVDTIHNNRFTICKLPRQSGKSTTLVSYILHYVVFNANMNVDDATTLEPFSNSNEPLFHDITPCCNHFGKFSYASCNRERISLAVEALFASIATFMFALKTT
tara:strand:+ start:192 stop:695 length:504 start_codon:yes stop_codon:yes gene_type:complete